MEASGKRIEAGNVIGQAFQTYQNYAAPLLGGAVLVVGITSVIDIVLGLTGSIILVFAGLIVGLIGQVLYTGYVVKLVQDVRDGHLDQSVSDLFEAASPYVWTLVLNGILYAIGVFFGFLALIVPGLILITIWAVVAPSIVVEDQGVIEAFGRSRELVRGNGWTVFFVILIAFLIVFIIGGVFALIGATIGDAGRVVLGTVGNILLVPVEALIASILFFDLGGGGSVSPTPEPEPAA